ncbi:MAG: hypothetical protein SAK29_05595 [Scytonema sp. PMC 1069.18]|nr:hypothetical protein [Scytonema sp. PMC 1069.18]MEC4884594.1 hypothetical protein [Scytonema sp. PMC 1070.18]
MPADTFVPPIWVVCTQEGLRVRIALEPKLLGTVSNGEQLQSIKRFQRFGSSSTNGDYIEGIAAVTSQVGLVIGIHRRLYVTWRTPALDPMLNFSRYFATVLALPIAMAEAYPKIPTRSTRAVTLLETQRFANPSNLHDNTGSKL